MSGNGGKVLAYHFTPTSNVKSILRDGLIRGERFGLSGFLSHDFRHLYPGGWPNFLTLSDADIEYLFAREYEILTVDITGYTQYPDIPSVYTEYVDYGSTLNTKLGLYFQELERDMQPVGVAAEFVIATTRTVAICHDIPAERISL